MTDAPDDVTVQDNPGHNRYEMYADGQLAGFLDYEGHGRTTTLLHTEVAGEFAGQGLAGRLVSSVLDELRDEGKMVESQCPYVDAYLDRHPEYADLRE